MATKKFLREPKEFTTEPSADEVHHGMKRGGHAHKKHHYAKGGEVESKAHEKAEMREMKKIEKELKHHEHMKASKAHHGLKKGGLAPKAGPNEMGGLAGGLSATRPMRKAKTGNIELTGYKHGGHTKKHHMAKGGEMLGKKMDSFETITTLKPKINVKDKVVGAKQVKSLHTKTGKVADTVAGGRAAGYKKGGTVSDSVAKRYLNDMKDGQHPKVKTGHTGEIKQKPAGYKKGGHVKHHAHGGHVAHHTTHGHGDHGHMHMHKESGKHAHGHDKIDGHPMKHGGKMHHTSKISTHMKKGGKCNY
jgi:hypothetical protein